MMLKQQLITIRQNKCNYCNCRLWVINAAEEAHFQQNPLRIPAFKDILPENFENRRTKDNRHFQIVHERTGVFGEFLTVL